MYFLAAVFAIHSHIVYLTCNYELVFVVISLQVYIFINDPTFHEVCENSRCGLFL